MLLNAFLDGACFVVVLWLCRRNGMGVAGLSAVALALGSLSYWHLADPEGWAWAPMGVGLALAGLIGMRQARRG